MNKIYKIKLNRKDLNGDQISCSGKQLSSILAEMSQSTSELIWYIVDVMVPGEYVIQPYSWEHKYCQKPLKIGSTDDLVAFALDVSQFERGIFLGVPKNRIGEIAWSTKVFDTEETDYIEPSDIVIKAFDTSYFEILSKHRDVIDRLTGRFNHKGSFL